MPGHSVDDELAIDPSKPFQNIVVCCTSIPPEQRTELAHKVAELGGVHKYDLTPEVTHLVVGEYDTLKYRHVARERPDVKAMHASWVEAVSELWRNDDDIDFPRLEKEHRLRPLETGGAQNLLSGARPGERSSLLICLTGFGDQRDSIAGTVASNGGQYSGDLTRKCTHLIVNKPEGKKFAAAKSWGIHTVTLNWLEQSVERGMILDEACYDPLLPEEQQGVGALVKRNVLPKALGKRSRLGSLNDAAEEGARKLRRATSIKLSSQKDNLWSDILRHSEPRTKPVEDEAHGGAQAESPTFQPRQPHREQGIFSGSVFVTHGFTPKRAQLLDQTITALGGLMVPLLSDSETLPCSHRFLVIPQASQPDSHPKLPQDGVHVVTEFYIERCLHNKRFFCPSEHVLGRPFPLFPIPGFSELRICSAAFTGIELNQVANSVEQLGATYDENFGNTASVLLCRDLKATRRDKLEFALQKGIPVVPADWLWECINTGYNVPLGQYIFPELLKKYPAPRLNSIEANKQGRNSMKQPLQRTRSEPIRSNSKSTSMYTPHASAGIDTSGFEGGPFNKNGQSIKRPPLLDSTTSADFETAPSHQGEQKAPLGELSSASINKSPSASKSAIPPPRSRASSSACPPEPEPLATPTLSNSKAVGEADLAREEARAAERQVLSSKISTLLQSTTTGATSDEEITSDSARRPRRRQVLGRALSNASTSATDSFRVPPAVPPVDQKDEGVVEGGEASPPTTQLEYCDPEAQEYRAAVMSRMERGGTGTVKVNIKPAGRRDVTTLGPQSFGAVSRRSLRSR